MTCIGSYRRYPEGNESFVPGFLLRAALA